jgi:hypothetical protein
MKSLIAAICQILLIASISYAQGWHGIVPLHSTRTDVEQLIGTPMQPNGVTYDLKDERVSVIYSGGGCEKGWPYGWNVPPGKVISIIVYPKTELTLASLGIDLAKFDKSISSRMNGDVNYTNKDEGISISTDSSGKVLVIQYEPAAKDRRLLCPDAAARELEIEKGESALLNPEVTYSNISSRERKIRLDYFVDRLQRRTPQSKVYIIGYGGRRSLPNEAQLRANQAKNYLIKEHRINTARIVIIDGGYKDDVQVELYIISPSAPKPLPSPNIYPKDVQIINGKK